MKKHKAQQLRIIAGKWRSRKIQFPDGIEGLRPTTDRIRETAFNWLAHDLIGAQCLDLFAGSGALSFEALSRGATHVTQLDTHSHVIKQLQTNAKILDAEHLCSIQRVDALTWLSQQQSQKQSQREGQPQLSNLPTQPYNIVFIDPPFNSELITPCLAALAQSKLLATKALIYIEVSSATRVNYPDSWALLKQRNAGQVCFSLWQTS